jgi:hypothetical protein
MREWRYSSTILILGSRRGELRASLLSAAAHQLRQDKHQDVRQKRQKLTSASWLRPEWGGFHNPIRLNCAPFFASCRRHRVLTITCLDACRCAAYLRHFMALERALGTNWIGGWMGPRAGLDAVKKRKFLPLPGIESRPLGLPSLA